MDAGRWGAAYPPKIGGKNWRISEIQLPPRQVASLDDVEEAHCCLYIKQSNGYVLRPQVAADFDCMERELRLAQLQHEREMLIEKEVLTERCQRLEREADSAAGRPIAQPKPAESENSFTQQLARLKSGLVH